MCDSLKLSHHPISKYATSEMNKGRNPHLNCVKLTTTFLISNKKILL